MDKKTFTCEIKKNIRGKIARADFVSAGLEKLYPDAACSLEYSGDPFRLLVMARLSAQCTDARVNIVSKELFYRFPDCRSLAEAPLSEVERIVYPCGVYRVKAKNIVDMSKAILSDFGGEVPRTKAELMSLPGIGQKIANLMLGDVFGEPMIVPDTHLIRLSGRFGLTDSKNPDIVEREVSRLIEKSAQSDFCHRAVLFGREFCRAVSPDCENCPLKKML